jgi:hypothetical protein
VPLPAAAFSRLGENTVLTLVSWHPKKSNIQSKNTKLEL